MLKYFTFFAIYDKIIHMKRQITTLLAILFIISTLATSLHELLPHHHSSDCQICTLVQNDNALAPEQVLHIDIQQASFKTPTKLNSQIISQAISTLGSRAPPSFS